MDRSIFNIGSLILVLVNVASAYENFKCFKKHKKNNWAFIELGFVLISLVIAGFYGTMEVLNLEYTVVLGAICVRPMLIVLCCLNVVSARIIRKKL